MGPIVGSLIGTGVTLGVVHVLTGPDHVSALATLSANVTSWTAFFLGVRWGLGHSTGLLTIGIIFIIIDHAANDSDTIEIPEGVSRFFELFVGIFMVFLGLYGIRRARDHKARADKRHAEGGGGLDNSIEEDSPRPFSHQHHHNHGFTEQHRHDSLERNSAEPCEMNDDTDIDDDESKNICVRLVSKISTTTMALTAGIIHGLAGPGGVLGVIPAVRLHDAKLAAIYLGFFCTSSTLTMGTLAVLYGTCSAKIGTGLQNTYLIEMVSACFSIVIGVLWLLLIALDKLDDVFP